MGNFTENIADRVRTLVQPDILMANLLAGGEIFWVIEDSDTDFNSLAQRFGNKNVFTTLTDAYNAATTNRNDIILLSGNTTHSLSAGIAWTKNRIHVIGLDGGGRLVQQGAKVQLATAATSAYVVKVTGVRNTFKNVKFIQAATAATGLHVLEEGGEGNLYDHCSFVFGVVDNLDLTTATEVLCGSDSATFTKCLFGTETLLTSAARTVFTIDQVTASQEFKSNIVEECIFMISSSSATALLVGVAANTDVLFTNLFNRCVFMASLDSAGGAAITNAVASASSLVKGTLNFAFPAAFGCTNFCAGTTAQVQTYGPATSAQAGEAGTPS
ncbi:hypothetical protein HY469_02245 [Candidatus Roizmanbacteria bacterium]|nr:hypothetical protein [Candidatus Roizmanbacteria bacterium]